MGNGIVCPLVVVLAVFFVFADVAWAHRPLFAEATGSEPDSALRISDPSVSHVMYVKLTEDEPQKWFRFDNHVPREVPVQVGIPVAVAEGAAEPVVRFFGPGGFTEPVALLAPGEGHRFYEPVTGTESHIVVDTRVALSQVGTYYGVVHEASGRGGKVWVSVGQREGLSWRDIPRLPGWIATVRRFHEVSGWPRWAWMSALGILAVGFGIGLWARR